MSDERWALVSLLAFFSMHWVPLGQQGFLAQHWMKLGGLVAPLLMFFAFTARSIAAGPWWIDVRLAALLLTAAYMLHQVEEHWIDLLGRRYPLYELLNQMLANAGIVLVNAVAHMAQALASWAYNPGLATAVLLFLSLSISILAGSYRSSGVGLAPIL